MKREKLESYLGKKVTVTLYGDEFCEEKTISGILTRADADWVRKRFGYSNPKEYLLEDCGWKKTSFFRCSHVKKCVEAR